MSLRGSSISTGGDNRSANCSEQIVTVVVVEYAVGNDSIGSLRKDDCLCDSVAVYNL